MILEFKNSKRKGSVFYVYYIYRDFIGIAISKEKHLNLISQIFITLGFLVFKINTVKEVVSTLIVCTSVCMGYLV